MLELNKYELPSSIECGGSFFLIDTDFRKWISFCVTVEKHSDEICNTTFNNLFKGEIPELSPEVFDALCNFAYPFNPLPRASSMLKSNDKILDYELDADLIFSAFYEQYGIDLCDRETSLHWWKFKALLNGLHDTELNKVIEFRSYNPNDKTKEKDLRKELKRIWKIEEKQKKALSKETSEFNNLFSKK